MMKIDESSFHMPLESPERPATGETMSDALRQGSSAEYDDHYQALLDATVMMVDDEPTTIDVIQAFLEDKGYKYFVTTTQSTGALELLASKNPDVLLLDLMMPKVTGFDILAAMRRHSKFRHIPVIVLTSSNESETKLKALQLGATDFLAKPVDSSELALRLRNTLAAKTYQDRLAYFDVLTGLPNRRMFMDRLNLALRCAKRDRKIGAVLHIDLDRFKKINDTLGHSVGDALLKVVSQRLEECIRASDFLGRLGCDSSRSSLSRVGGDEFTVLFPQMACVENAEVVARRILSVLEKPLDADNHELFVTASIGIAVFPNDGEDTDTLLKHADVSMYHAKQRGGNTYAFYSSQMNAKALERLSLENHLRKALDRDELVLHYQPKIDIRTGRVIGAEALLRWQHPEIGIVSPGDFIPLAEETGLIVPFGEWVLHTACKQNKAWRSAGLRPRCIAVNLSSRQFRDRKLMQTIREALESSGLEPEYLTLELTENGIMENAGENVEALHQIKKMGVRLSVDDFGTGYSSLSYLKQFPLDELKVDRSFVREIHTDEDNAAIVAAIIAMAHRLGLTVVAEGVETEHQLEFLREQGCDEYQGFLCSKPVAASEFATLLARVERT